MTATKHAGLVLYNAYDPYRTPLIWLDLETGAMGELDYRQVGEGIEYIADRTGVWMMCMSEGGHEPYGPLRVTRKSSGIATRFVPDVFVRSVSPDETRAVISIGDELFDARVTASGFEPGKRLGVGLSYIYSWWNGGVIVSGNDTVLHVTPGARPKTLRTAILNTDSTCGSNDGALLAWVPSSYDAMVEEGATSISAIEQVLHIASLTDPRTPTRTVNLGSGQATRCAFAPDGRTLVCLVEVSTMSAKRALSIDVATGAVTMLAPEVEYGLAFSPDSRWVMLAGDALMIASLDGRLPTLTLPNEGSPVAWLR